MISLLGVLALIAAGCSAQAAGDRTPVIQAVGEGTTMTNTISVTGTGEVSGTPDTVIVDLGVSVLRSTVDAATGEAARLATALIDALTSNGVVEKDITTTNYSIYPEYDYSGSQQKLTGYRVTNTVSAKIRDVSNAGAVIDAATAAGGNDVVVNGIRFDLGENSELVKTARAVAWADAHDKASQLADLAGVALGSAVSIAETTTPSSPPIVYERAMAASDAATPIQPGEQTVSVVIQVQFGIGG